MNDQQRRLQHLRDRGFEPTMIADIGANIGQWFMIANSVFPNATIFSVEANPTSFEYLKKVNPNSECILLGDRVGEEVDFFVNSNDDKCTGASIYLENTHHYNNPNVKKLQMTTLDSLGKVFDLIKIDVQGAELDVLRGGLNTLQKSTFVVMELAVMRYNQGAPLINEVIEYMNRNGFMFFDIYELHYMHGALFQVDVCFINKEHKDMVEL